MCVCMYVHKHVYIYMYIYPYIHTYIHHAHTHIFTYVYTYTYRGSSDTRNTIYMYIYIHAYIHTGEPQTLATHDIYIYIYIYIYIHTYIHTCIHTYRGTADTRHTKNLSQAQTIISKTVSSTVRNRHTSIDFALEFVSYLRLYTYIHSLFNGKKPSHKHRLCT